MASIGTSQPVDGSSLLDELRAEEAQRLQSKSNTLKFHGNRSTMNLNPLILTNIQNSPYYKNNVTPLETFEEVVDEIFHRVSHLEPWERGTRKPMAGGISGGGAVRGVGAGGVISTAYCLLYKLHEMHISRRQLENLLNHRDSPYIRGLGFLYIRYTQPPADLWEWFEPYLEDEEMIDVKAGEGCNMTFGDFVLKLMSQLDWFGTLFPRIPVPIEKKLHEHISAFRRKQMGGDSANAPTADAAPSAAPEPAAAAATRKSSSPQPVAKANAARADNTRSRSRDDRRDSRRSRSRSPKRRSRSRSRERRREREEKEHRERRRSHDEEHSKRRHSRSTSRNRDRERERHRHSSREQERESNARPTAAAASRSSGGESYEDLLQRARERQRREDRDRHRHRDD